MYDLISVGMITVDMFYRGSSLTQDNGRFQLTVGGKYFADEFHMNIGGGATNVAVGATVLGSKVGLLAQYSGGQFASYIQERLDALRVDRTMCVAVDHFSNVSSILVSDQGERTIINYRTPHQHLLDTLHAHIHPDNTRSIYLANLPDIAIAERIRFLGTCKSNGIIIFSNLGVNDCRKSEAEIEAYLRSIDVLVVNRYEFADMVKKPYDVLDFHNNVKKIYFPHLTHLTVVITGGSKGSWGYTNERIWYETAAPVKKVVDTTGAGDAYTAGFIASYLKESNVQKAMANGSIYAARIISGMGTSETR